MGSLQIHKSVIDLVFTLAIANGSKDAAYQDLEDDLDANRIGWT